MAARGRVSPTAPDPGTPWTTRRRAAIPVRSRRAPSTACRRRSRPAAATRASSPSGRPARRAAGRHRTRSAPRRPRPRPSSSPPIAGSSTLSGPAVNASGMVSELAQASTDHRPGHRPDGDEQEVVRAQPGASGEDTGHHQAGRDHRREPDRLPPHDEAVAEAQEGVEVERDDGDRHGPGSVPARRVSAGRHVGCQRFRGS